MTHCPHHRLNTPPLPGASLLRMPRAPHRHAGNRSAVPGADGARDRPPHLAGPAPNPTALQRLQQFQQLHGSAAARRAGGHADSRS